MARSKSWFFLLFLVSLVLFSQACIPPSTGVEWKDYSKRWHVCFTTVRPGQSFSVSHKFLYPTMFDAGTIFKVKGDFDSLDPAEDLPSQVTWTFGHFRKGSKLFEQSFNVPLDDSGRFTTFGAELTSPVTFQKNDIVKWSYAGIDVAHDTDIRLNIKF